MQTEEQDKIIFSSGKEKSLLVEARAGTGKTYTIVLIAKSFENKTFQVIVFNKKNQLEMSDRLPKNAIGSTAHSFCNKFIPRFKGHKPKLDTGKVFNLCFKNYNFKEDGLEKEEAYSIREDCMSLCDLISLCKSYFINPSVEDVLWIINHYQMTFNNPLDQISSDAIEILSKSDKDGGTIDFDDMIRFPVIENKINPQFDYFVIDEAQDNTPIRTILFKQMYEKGVNVIAVGDEFQSIYGFAGADCDSLSRIKESVKCQTLPLTINFRCAKKIIEKAQIYVPDIKAWDESPDGEVLISDQDSFYKSFSYGDVALSRYNKIIIPPCFKLIKDGKKATIQGKDFGEMIIKMIRGFKSTTLDEFYSSLDRWRERQLKSNKHSSALDAIDDKFECLKFFADNSNTVEDIEKRVLSIFSDEKSDGLKFSTVHKAKGLEWDNVYILDSANFMQTRETQPWMIQQLRNLMYVAITRAKKNLIYV